MATLPATSKQEAKMGAPCVKAFADLIKSALTPLSRTDLIDYFIE